jgi:hypothetical protein
MKKQMKTGSSEVSANSLPIPGSHVVALAQAFLTELREGRGGEGPKAALAALHMEELKEGLKDDAHRKAFWINCYNAFNLHRMLQRPVQTLNERRKHFWGKDHTVAGCQWSLNAIEHGLLRRSKFWWARGWLRNPFPGSLERQLRLEKDDPRIHFALNCGANGCPAIRFYSVEGIENELNLATHAFFETEVHIAADGRSIEASSIFKMYLGDFGGLQGLKKWLMKYRPDLDSSLPIHFSPYDWTPNLHKFHN